MTRDFIHINDFVVVVEHGRSSSVQLDTCNFEEPQIAVAFYGSGNVDLNVRYGNKQKSYKNTKGLALSFYSDSEVAFEHTISANKNLDCILVVTALRNLDKLPYQEGEIFSELLQDLVTPKDHYVEGPRFYMTPEMERIIDSILSNEYTGKTKIMFFRSQIFSLLSHYFGHLAMLQQQAGSNQSKDKLIQARDILLSNLDNPPSLVELAEQIGFNTTKLKREFKDFFGVPVFKYLQNERLNNAHELISKKKATVQEAAWEVGYDSLSSFSNAFAQKFGYRPSEIK